MIIKLLLLPTALAFLCLGCATTETRHVLPTEPTLAILNASLSKRRVLVETSDGNHFWANAILLGPDSTSVNVPRRPQRQVLPTTQIYSVTVPKRPNLEAIAGGMLIVVGAVLYERFDRVDNVYAVVFTLKGAFLALASGTGLMISGTVRSKPVRYVIGERTGGPDR